ncbi:hypothetical protein Q5P01_010781 [Channa striata]|uniref:ZBR-type domain-containing protein n=1 Tax=Channa striata TaxID=64152 RepID=A0AA88SQ09_CHASR|nr:hypothetical protein Q5P01_010781 [Channa striata]
MKKWQVKVRRFFETGCKARSTTEPVKTALSTGQSALSLVTLLSLGEFYTPKENLRLCVTPKGKVKESAEGSRREVQQPPATSWCETPKVHKRDATLRPRLLMCKPKTDVRIDRTRSPCTKKTSVRTRSEHWLSVSFDSLETVTGALASSTNVEQDLSLSGTKRRTLFSQEVSQSEVSGKTNGLHDSSSILFTPSYTHTPNYIRSACEDSGFSSLTLDKSQDDSVDHDGSFQELLLSASRGSSETPNMAEAKRRSRLQRQHRLSTLKEGGSQSEEDLMDRKHQHHRCLSHSKDVFDDFVTPRSALSNINSNGVNYDGVASAKDSVTPLRATVGKSENVNSFNMAPSDSDETPLRTTPVSLSLTPALQLVHAMCQQKAQMFFGQSPSLKEQLKSTLALAETPQTFRTTMPLAGLIGRKMGLGKVDILTELKKRHLRHILAVIFSHLTSESIHRCGQVCKSWNQIIQEDKEASFRRRNYLSEVEATPELRGALHVPDAETRLTLLKRSALKTVQAHSSSKRDRFLEVAKTLFSDECLKPCPRCENPARCHSVKGEGVCSRDDCGFQFCTACLSAFHGSRQCGSQSLGRHKRDIILPGSAQSKRNVRRL